MFRRCAGYFRAISQSETVLFLIILIDKNSFFNGILTFVTITGTRVGIDSTLLRVQWFSLYFIAFSSLLARGWQIQRVQHRSLCRVKRFKRSTRDATTYRARCTIIVRTDQFLKKKKSVNRLVHYTRIIKNFTRYVTHF